jgi:hypothetical protein
MKKTVLALLLVGSGTAILAQEPTTNTNNTSTNSANGTTTNSSANMNSTTSDASTTGTTNNDNMSTSSSSSGSYNAYGSTMVNVPNTVQYNFNRDYPGISDAQWSQSYNGLYRATYKQNNQDMAVYYGNNGESFMVALPVLQNLVPETVASKARSMYGSNIYDITRLRGVDGNDVYQVRIIENGQTRAEWIGEDGSTVAQVFRSESNNAAMSETSNGWNSANNINNGSNTSTNQSSGNMNSSNTTNDMNSNTNNNGNLNSSATNSTDNSTMSNSSNSNSTMSSTNNSTGSDVNTDTNSNSKSGDKVKIKVEGTNGNESKMKIKNGKVKTKE